MAKKITCILLSLILICLAAIVALQIYSVKFKPMEEKPEPEYELSTLILAGLTDVTGSGVTVTVSDSDDTMFADPSLSVIHDEDILSIINELYDADAEAISVNGERLVATSEIRCAGSTISINNNRYSEPYVIKAIGNPQNLENALNMKDGVMESLSYYGIKIDIEKSDNLLVEAYNGSKDFVYASPVK